MSSPGKLDILHKKSCYFVHICMTLVREFPPNNAYIIHYIGDEPPGTFVILLPNQIIGGHAPRRPVSAPMRKGTGV